MNHLSRILYLTILLTLSSSVAAKNFYRYKNKAGELIINDQLTKEMIADGYDEINETGKLVRRVPPGKTLAQLDAERLAKIEEKKKQLQLKRQIRHDAELLRQFGTVSDIIHTRDAQLLALEQRIRIQGSKSGLLKLQLEDQQKQAATYERLGQPVPTTLQKEIDTTHRQIDDNTNNAKILEGEKVKVASRYEKDIVRFQDLASLRKKLKKNENNDGSKPVIYDCDTLAICAKAWQLAQVYARDNASGQIEIITNTLILTSKPEKDQDIGISFSRIPAPEDKYQIVLEVSCSNSEYGAEFCKTDSVKNLRKNYLKLIHDRLK